MFIYYLIHPKGKGGTKRLGLLPRKNKHTNYTHKWLPKLQNKTNKQIKKNKEHKKEANYSAIYQGDDTRESSITF